MMTVIQKWWRGYQARKHFRIQVKTAYFIMKMNFYNEMAVRIQRRWRGYYVRKYVHNYYTLKKYLEGLALKNEIVRKELNDIAQIKEKENLKKDFEMKEKRKDYQARKMHYLLSTKQVPGVFNSPFKQYPDEMEFRLERSKPLSHKKHQKQTDKSVEIADWSDCRHPFLFSSVPPLPPIDKNKPQGPFRDTAEVLQQRYKPLEPTLRVATSINSEQEAREKIKREEWCKRIQDKIFFPFSSLHKTKTYEPSLHTSTDYKKMPYGTLGFREEQQERRISNKDFKTVFTPITLFDKYGRTYSKAGEAV
ncbi:spermatogenesis-associated protein 17 [Bombina bombina]|uniref:spermatogenesis-associated protein 17 n=1 Tax=Bombina bombina TaxID=8345 RepID=UPI00235A8D09|nr:spermatogenesis-associated protein 17 [Bombina bombina]